MFFFCKIFVSLKLNLIEQVKQFYLLTITLNLSTTSPEPKQKKKRSKRQTRIKKNIVIFDELGRKKILILIQEESAQEKGTRKRLFCLFLVPNRGLRRPTIPPKRKKSFYCSRLCLGFDSLLLHEIEMRNSRHLVSKKDLGNKKRISKIDHR